MTPDQAEFHRFARYGAGLQRGRDLSDEEGEDGDGDGDGTGEEGGDGTGEEDGDGTGGEDGDGTGDEEDLNDADIGATGAKRAR